MEDEEFEYKKLPDGLEGLLMDGTIESIVTKDQRRWVYDPELRLMKTKKESKG